MQPMARWATDHEAFVPVWCLRLTPAETAGRDRGPGWQKPVGGDAPVPR